LSHYPFHLTLLLIVLVYRLSSRRTRSEQIRHWVGLLSVTLVLASLIPNISLLPLFATAIVNIILIVRAQIDLSQHPVTFPLCVLLFFLRMFFKYVICRMLFILLLGLDDPFGGLHLIMCCPLLPYSTRIHEAKLPNYGGGG